MHNEGKTRGGSNNNNKKKCTIFQRSVLQKCEKEKKKKAKHNQTYLIEAT